MKMPQFFLRQSVLPFETLFALFCLWRAGGALVQFGLANDLYAEVTGRPLSVLFAAVFFVAGLCMYLGIGKGNAALEILGLRTVAYSLLAQGVATTIFFGFAAPRPPRPGSPAPPSLFAVIVGIAVFNGLFILACALRIHALQKQRRIVEIRNKG